MLKRILSFGVLGFPNWESISSAALFSWHGMALSKITAVLVKKKKPFEMKC
jgi:hypothetical protein